jgi:hypothetical protein
MSLVSYKSTRIIEGSINEFRVYIFAGINHIGAMALPIFIPTLTGPSNNSVTSDVTPLLSWDAISNAVEYRLLLADNPQFLTPIMNTTLITINLESVLLSEGTHYWQVQARDADGNWGIWSPADIFTVDTQTPIITLDSPLNNSIHISGTSVNVIVTDSHLAEVLYHWDTESNQSWSFPYSTILPSGDGQHILHIYANDSAGNILYRKFVFVTDDTIPLIVLESPSNHTAQISGALVDLDVSSPFLHIILYNWDNNPNQSWSSPFQTSIPSGEGDHILNVYANNTAGSSVYRKFLFIVDDTPPTITLLSPLNGSIMISGSLINIDIIDALLDTAIYIWNGNANQTFLSPYDTFLPAGDGAHVLHIYANDSLGNLNYKRYEFFADNSKPLIIIESPLNNSVYNSGTLVDIAVTGSYLDNVSYYWDSGLSLLWSSPYQSITPTGDGVHTLFISAFNTLGSSSSAVFVVTVDDTPPIVSLVSPENMSLHQSGTSIDLAISDPNGIDQILYKWDSGVNTLLISPYSVSLPTGDGQHILSIYAEDSIGNSQTISFVFITDDTPPTLDHPADVTYTEGETGNTITWTASGEQPVSYAVYRDDVLLEENSWSGSSYSINVDSFSVGVYTFELVIYDEAGNFVSDEVQVTVTAPETSVTEDTTTTTTTAKKGTYPTLLVPLALIGFVFIFRKKRKR